MNTFEMEDELLDWIVDEQHAGERMDKVVNALLHVEEVSRTQIQQWIREGHATVNGALVKPNYRLNIGDCLMVRVPDPVEDDLIAEAILLDIAYEDKDVIVVNKPRGMVVHPAPGHVSGTLVHGLMHHCGDLSGINGRLRPGIVHRIDKDTSGLLMAAKNDRAHLSLSSQLKAHSVTRKYMAIVHGNVAHDHGTIDAPIGRDLHDRKLFTVTKRNGKDAVTHFTVIERYKEYTFIELKLETGRTHQIRVHMQFIGHPLIGDPLYGRSKGVTMAGQALHAAVLGFTHPQTHQYLEFSAPMPEDMQHVIEILKSK